MKAFIAILACSLFASIFVATPARAAAGSILFNGSNYLSASATNSKFNFDTGDFTIEWWQKMSSGSAARVFSFGCYSSQRFQASIEGGTLYLGINGAWATNVTLTNYLNKWSHLAIVRSSGALKIYQNGVEIRFISYGTAIDASSYILSVGAENSDCTYRSGTYFGGKLAKLRMTKSAIYTSAFTPSPSYGVVANTILMLDTDTTAPFADTGNTGTAVTFTNNSSVAGDSEVPALPKQTQSALAIVQSTVTYKDSLALTTTGGSGVGEVTYSVVSGNCTIAGTTLTPTASGSCVIKATKAGDDTYDPVNSPNKTITISARALTITGIAISNKSYNGNNTATITGTPVLNGVVAGDTIALSTGAAQATFSSAAVGNAKSVTVTGYSISGTNSTSYTLTQPSGLTASILTGQPVTTSSIPETSTYRAPTPLTFTTNSIAGKVTFYADKVRIPGCIGIPVSAANAYSLTCSWKPSKAGLVAPVAIFTPNDSNYASVTLNFPASIIKRRTTPR